MSQISRFMSKAVTLAKIVVGDRGEVVDFALVSCTVCGSTSTNHTATRSIC